MSKPKFEQDGARYYISGDHVIYAGPQGSQEALDAGIDADFSKHAPVLVDGAQALAFDDSGDLVWKAPLNGKRAPKEHAKKPAAKRRR